METNTYRDEIQKKLPLLGKGQTHCPVCGKRLISDIGKIALYDDFNVESGVLSHVFLYCRHKKCRILYVDISKITKLASLAAPNHIITVHQKYVTMKERRSYVNDMFLAPETRQRSPLPEENEIEHIVDGTAALITSNLVEEHPGKLIIYKNKCNCLSCERLFGKSSIENRAMFIDCIWGEDILVHVQFCRTCGMYYMSDVALRSTEMKFGRILIEREFEDFDWASFKGELNPESLLHRFGYNANENSRENERRAILKHLLDTGRFEKYEIINHLSFLISMNGNRCFKAKPKWEADIQFVTDYRLSEQKIVYGLTLQKKHNPKGATANT